MKLRLNTLLLIVTIICLCLVVYSVQRQIEMDEQLRTEIDKGMEVSETLQVVLSGDQFDGDSLKTVLNKGAIHYLHLGNTRIVGQDLLNVMDHKNLAYCANFEIISAQITNSAAVLEFASHLSRLVYLRVLLSSVDIGEEVDLLSSVDNLRELDFSMCMFTEKGLIALGRLESIEVLDISNTNVRDRTFRHLLSLASLRELNLFGTAVEGAEFGGIEALDRLEKLDLRECSSFGNAGLQNVFKLPQLRELDISGTAVTDNGLDNVAIPRSLQLMSIYGTRITKSRVHQLAADNPGLEIKSDFESSR